MSTGTLKKTANGKVDKRTKEYKELVERAKKARLAKARAAKKAAAKPAAKTTSRTTASKTTASKTTARKTTTKKTTASSVKRRADGKVDLRTKEGKAVAQRMAKARAARGSEQKGIAGLLKKLLK